MLLRSGNQEDKKSELCVGDPQRTMLVSATHHECSWMAIEPECF